MKWVVFMDFHVEFEFWLRAGRTEQNTTVYKSELQHIGRWQTVPTIRIIPNVLYWHASQCLRRRLSQRSKLGLHAFHPVRPRNAPNKLTVFVPAVGSVQGVQHLRECNACFLIHSRHLTDQQYCVYPVLIARMRT